MNIKNRTNEKNIKISIGIYICIINLCFILGITLDICIVWKSLDNIDQDKVGQTNSIKTVWLF